MINKGKKNIIIVPLIIIILAIGICFMLEIIKRQDSIAVGSYIENKYEKNNLAEEKEIIVANQGNNNDKTNNLENVERIIVILNQKDKNEPPKEEHVDTEETIYAENNQTSSSKDKTESSKEEHKEEEEPIYTENNQTTSISDKKYYIKVNNEANVVTIYTKDNEGQYTVPVKAMICSTGTATPTSGTYDIKLRWEWLGLFGDVYGHYSTQIVGNILFHSVPYLEKGNPASLEYWEYDKLGTSCSAGCVRLTVADAKWIYDNIEQGTLVEFYSSEEPGPLRKTNRKKNIRE